MAVLRTTTYGGHVVAVTLLLVLPAMSPHAQGPPVFPGQIRRPDLPAKDPDRLAALTFPLLATWITKLPGLSSAPPAYDASSAYVPLRGGWIVSVELRSGLVRWTRDLDTTLAPAVGGALVFVAASDAIHALDPATGRTRWTVPSPSALSSPPRWNTGWLLLATVEGALVALRASDGEIIWSANLGSPLRSSPSAGGDRLYVALEDGRVAALRLSDGAKLWERRLGGPPTGILATDERVFAGSLDNFFYCLDTLDGRIRWRWPTGGDVIGAIAMDRSSVYFNSLDNTLRALDRRSGSQRWKAALPMRPTSGPVLLGQVVLVSGLSPEIHGYHAADGSPAGRFIAPGDLSAPLHGLASLEPFGTQVFVLAGNGEILALEQTASPLPTWLSEVPGEKVPLEVLPSPVSTALKPERPDKK